MRTSKRREPRWLSLEAVLAIHDEQVMRFGGSPGILQRTSLDSALHRPQNPFLYDESASLPQLAALYLVGLVNAHAFVDGNKRVGLAAMLVFLRLNGHPITVRKDELYAFVIGVATGRVREEAAAEWIRARLP